MGDINRSSSGKSISSGGCIGKPHLFLIESLGTCPLWIDFLHVKQKYSTESADL